MNNFKAALMKEGGCGLIIYVIGGGFFLLGSIYLVYFFLSGGDPEIKKFRDECHARHMRGYTPGSVPDFVIERAVLACDRELKEYLRRK